MASSYSSICERLSTEALKQELKDLEQEREEKEKILLEKKKLYEQHPELNPSPDKDTYFTMEEARELFHTAIKISIARRILAVRIAASKEAEKLTSPKETAKAILTVILFLAGFLTLIYIADLITKNYVGWSKAFTNMGIILGTPILILISIYLYRKITKR